MTGITVTVRGIDTIRAQLATIGRAVPAEIGERALTPAAHVVLDRAKSGAPPGRIRNAIVVTEPRQTDRGRVQVSIAINDPDASHGLLVELGTGQRVRKSGGGTGSMRAKPFMRPALDESHSDVESIVAKGVDDIVAESVR